VVPENGRKMKRTMSKHEFRPQNSYLDVSHTESAVNESGFRGFYNLIGFALLLFVLTENISHTIATGTVIGLDSLQYLFSRFEILPALLSLFAFSFGVVTLQQLIAKGIIPILWSHIIYHVSVAGIFISTIYIAVNSTGWPLVQTGFYFTEVIIMCMKIHSYFMTNQDEHRKYLEDVKNDTVRKPDLENGLLVYPHNLTFSNWIFYLSAPTLVYEVNYPRTLRIRVGYVLEKVVSTLSLFIVLHIVSTRYIGPIMERSPKMSAFEAISQLVIPYLLVTLVTFYIVFECICNAFAELTRFADRDFYDDWWNSTTFDEFARKWNKPVHEFLLRHVYLESQTSLQLGRWKATILTFTVSSVLHELFMSVVFRTFRPWFFGCQMLQLPLILLGRRYKGTRLGNLMFWFSITCGVPMLSILYGQEYYRQFQ